MGSEEHASFCGVQEVAKPHAHSKSPHSAVWLSVDCGEKLFAHAATVTQRPVSKRVIVVIALFHGHTACFNKLFFHTVTVTQRQT